MNWEDGFAFELSSEARMIQDMARSFAVAEVQPLAAQIDREHAIPEELVAKLGAAGFLGCLVPEEYGGGGLSSVAYALLIEELAAACASTAILVSAHSSLCVAPLVLFGSSQQKQSFLPKLAQGSSLGCFALSEPGTGSDAAAMLTTCTASDAGWKVSGTKNWITNGPIASCCILFATADKSAGHKGVRAFVHDLSEVGIARGKPEEKLGICGSKTCSIFYEDVTLEKDSLLGSDNQGFSIAMTTLDGGRIGVAAQAVGIARASLDAALQYARDRKAFGKPIGQHQSVGNYLADMSVQLDAARYLTLGAARLKDEGKEFSRQAAAAKLYASQAANFCAYKALQIHGGYGYVKEYPVERFFRDARITEIYEGTSEIQRLVIARNLLAQST
jgi:butyryl-CoA dehydrogenase